jgi:hypothetical protein
MKNPFILWKVTDDFPLLIVAGIVGPRDVACSAQILHVSQFLYRSATRCTLHFLQLPELQDTDI